MIASFLLFAWPSRQYIIADLCWSLVAWSVMLLLLWFVDPSTHTLEKFLCPDSFIPYLQQTAHHNVDTSDIFQVINIAMQPRHQLIIFLVGLLAFVKRLFGHLSLRPLRISSTGSRCPFSSRSTSWTWHHFDDSAFLARGKYSIITNTCAFLLQVVQPMWPATEMADCYFHPWCVHMEAFVCYLWPAEKILFLVALIAWTVCNWRRFSCFFFCQCPKAFIQNVFG